MTTTLPTVGEYVTVTRSIRRPVQSPLVFVHHYPNALFVGGGLRFERPFVVGAHWPVPAYRAPAWLRLTRRHWPAVVVEIELVSPTRAEVHLRPRSMRVANWSARRQRRYFDAAHRAADELAVLLEAPSVPAVERTVAAVTAERPESFEPAA